MPDFDWREPQDRRAVAESAAILLGIMVGLIFVVATLVMVVSGEATRAATTILGVATSAGAGQLLRSVAGRGG